MADAGENHLSEASLESQTRRAIDRHEVLMRVGPLVLAAGIALAIATALTTEYSLALAGWLFIAAAGVCGLGLMLTALGLTARHRQVATSIFVATPGALIAAVSFVMVENYGPIDPGFAYQYFDLVCNFLIFLGLLWLILGPYLAYRARTYLPLNISPSAQEQTSENSEVGRKRDRSSLVPATWFVGFSPLLTAVLAWILSKH